MESEREYLHRRASEEQEAAQRSGSEKARERYDGPRAVLVFNQYDQLIQSAVAGRPVMSPAQRDDLIMRWSMRSTGSRSWAARPPPKS